MLYTGQREHLTLTYLLNKQFSKCITAGSQFSHFCCTGCYRNRAANNTVYHVSCLCKMSNGGVELGKQGSDCQIQTQGTEQGQHILTTDSSIQVLENVAQCNESKYGATASAFASL